MASVTSSKANYATSMGRVLDARPDRFDFRDRFYAPPLRSLPPVFQ